MLSELAEDVAVDGRPLLVRMNSEGLASWGHLSPRATHATREDENRHEQESLRHLVFPIARAGLRARSILTIIRVLGFTTRRQIGEKSPLHLNPPERGT